MNNNIFFTRNPLSITNFNNPKSENNSFSAVIGNPGSGKSAFVIQLGIDSLLKEKRIIHVSLNKDINKINARYEELFEILAKKNNFHAKNKLLEKVQSEKLIMTFKSKKFTVKILKNRLMNLQKSNIFYHDIMIIDGLNVDSQITTNLKELKSFSLKNKLHIWITLIIEDKHGKSIKDLFAIDSDIEKNFEEIIELRPVNNNIEIVDLKPNNKKDKSLEQFLFLDPCNMIIVQNDHEN